MLMLSEELGITKGDLVSIVGSGGKTTALSKLGEELSRGYKTLITSTTKIGMNQIRPKPKIYPSPEGCEEILLDQQPGLHFIMRKELPDERKLSGFPPEDVDFFYEYFDVVLSEADGSRGKLLKGWGQNEPVIAAATTKILGIINLKLLGQNISPVNVHRPEEFCKLTRSAPGETISFDTIKQIILSPAGLFKNSDKTNRRADKILFINMVDDDADKNSAEKFLNFLESELDFFDAVIYGSLLSERYAKIK